MKKQLGKDLVEEELGAVAGARWYELFFGSVGDCHADVQQASYSEADQSEDYQRNLAALRDGRDP
jgi:hypothetical protein